MSDQTELKSTEILVGGEPIKKLNITQDGITLLSDKLTEIEDKTNEINSYLAAINNGLFQTIDNVSEQSETGISEKLDYISGIKTNLMTAMQEKNVIIDETTPFTEYPGLIPKKKGIQLTSQFIGTYPIASGETIIVGDFVEFLDNGNGNVSIKKATSFSSSIGIAVEEVLDESGSKQMKVCYPLERLDSPEIKIDGTNLKVIKDELASVSIFINDSFLSNNPTIDLLSEANSRNIGNYNFYATLSEPGFLNSFKSNILEWNIYGTESNLIKCSESSTIEKAIINGEYDFSFNSNDGYYFEESNTNLIKVTGGKVVSNKIINYNTLNAKILVDESITTNGKLLVEASASESIELEAPKMIYGSSLENKLNIEWNNISNAAGYELALTDSNSSIIFQDDYSESPYILNSNFSTEIGHSAGSCKLSLIARSDNSKYKDSSPAEANLYLASMSGTLNNCSIQYEPFDSEGVSHSRNLFLSPVISKVSLFPNNQYEFSTTDGWSATNVSSSEFTIAEDKSYATFTFKPNGSGNISLIASATPIQYPISISATNVISDEGNLNKTVSVEQSATLKFTAAEGYSLPNSVAVSHAKGSWNKETGKLTISEPTGENDITVTITGSAIEYSITTNLQNVSAASNNPVVVDIDGATLSFVANEHYQLPSSITVTGADYSWSSETGVLTLSNPTSNVNITITALAIAYSISLNLTNIIPSDSNATEITVEKNETLTFVAETGYTLPESVEVSGADHTWVQDTGTLTLSNPVSNISITMVGTPVVYSISLNLTNTISSDANATEMTVEKNETLTFVAETGYTLPESVEVSGVNHTWDSITGALTLSNPTSNISITITSVLSVQKLQTPQNLAIDGTILSFDEVENATSYEIFANGTSIGTFNPPEEVKETLQTPTASLTGSQLDLDPVDNAETYTLYLSAETDASTASGTEPADPEVTSYSTLLATITDPTDISSEKYKLIEVNNGVITGMNPSKLYTIYLYDLYGGTPLYGTISYSSETSKWECTISHEYFYMTTVSDSSVSMYMSTAGTTFYANYSMTVLEGNEAASEEEIKQYPSSGLFPYYTCYAKGTKITLADGTYKNVEDIDYSDKLLVWDFDNGKYSEANPFWIKKPQVACFYYDIKFESGNELKLIGKDQKSHRLYSIEDNKFIYGNKLLGKSVYNSEYPEDKVISCEIVEEPIEYYNIITNYHLNCFINNVLSSCGYNNMYEIKNMKFVKDGNREIIPFEVYDVPIEYYENMRLGEQPEYLEKTNKYVKNMISHKKEV